MDIEKELVEFQDYLQNFAPNTIYNYALDVKTFLLWCDEEGVDNANKKSILQYKKMITDNFAIKTVNRKISSFNAYSQFRGLDLRIKSEKIHNQTFIDDMINNEEAREILHKIRENNDKRAEALFLGLFYTGARVSELLQIKLKNVGKNEITIKGKGSKYRKIFVPEKLLESFHDYIETEREAKGDLLFTGQRGAITRSSVGRILKKYALLADIEVEKVYPHAIRHLYTKNLVEKGVSYSAIKQLLGHTLSITDVYMQLSKRELLEIVNSISLD